MLKPGDIQGFDLAALTDALDTAALRQDRCRRQAQSIGIPADCPETCRAVDAIDADAAALAEASRFIATVRRFLEDEGHARRPAPIAALRLGAPNLAMPGRPNLIARAFAIVSQAFQTTPASRAEEPSQ
ncbi:hypothetical protein MKK55_12940 [Methylobacterium sp. J-059]|uniref:hypothetical protein n=1 Tax=Methylobacterium sp. J-059 TaxID=2836643 RepID=UPI001FB91BF8|nr:hypothetical protein [Methylobacterium sp. J-059]MCJ2039838.1 hypothetical protein [Methylobacterium sp. J-059]